MRNAKTSKKMALAVLLMLVILCLSAFSFASSATSGVAENSTGVMGDVISNGNSTANARANSSNIAEFTFRFGSTDYLTVKYPKKITIKLGDEIGANTSNSPRTSGMYNIDSQTNEQPNLVLEGHFGDAGNSNYQQIIRTGVWGFNGLNGNTLFNEYFNNYDFHTERNSYRGGGAVGSVGGSGVQFAVNTWDGADNNWVLCINNSGNYDGLDTVVWPQGTAKKAGTAVYTMPTGNSIVNFRAYEGTWGKSWNSKYSENTYPVNTPTITINVLDPEGLQSVINDAQNRKNNAKGVVEKALVDKLNEAITNANNWVTKARDYKQNFDINQETLEVAKNNVTKAIEAIENSQKFGVVDGGQYCVSTELRISKSAYDAAENGIASLDNSGQILKSAFKWKEDSRYDGGGYYVYTYSVNSANIENKNHTLTLIGTDKTFNFKIASWHGFADSSGNILSDLSKDNVLQNGQLTTCTNTSHTCRLQVNSLETGQKTQCQHTWSKADIESKTELWAHTYGEVKTTSSTCVTQGEKYQECTCGDKKHLETLAVDPNNHANLDESKLVWVAGQKVPGTETELTEAMHCGYAGKYGHLCSACNKYANEVEKAAGETPTGTISCDYNGQPIVVTTPPTCHSLGEGHRVCKNCSHTQKAVEPSEAETNAQLQKLPHNYDKSNLVVDTPPTCTAPGTGHFVCTNEGCNATTTEGVDPNAPELQPKGHDVDRTHVIVDTPPTCSSYGVGHYKCKNCEYIENIDNPQSVPELQMTDHVFSEDLTIDTHPTCTENGTGHYKCTGKNCLETKVADPETTPELKAKGHTRPLENEEGHLVIEVGQEPTCTTDGTGHYVCKECSTNVPLTAEEEPKLNKTGHNVEGQKIVVTKEPTCYYLGEGYRECLNCKEHIVVESSEAATAEELKIREHTLGELIVDTAPTCTVDGKGHYECTANGCSHRVEAEVSKEPTLQQTGHDFDRETVIVDVEPTCHKLGEGHYKCKKCDATEKITNPESIKELQTKEHVFSQELTIDTHPTCTENGTGHYKCTNTECTETKPADPNSVTELQATGHKRPEINTDGHFVEDTAPTCTTDGTGHYVCATCKTDIPLTVEEEPKLNKTGHNVEGQKVEVTKEPTCHSLGEGYRVCKNCSEHIVVEPSEAENFAELAKKDHVYNTSDIKDRVAPTCTKNGSAKYYCKEHANGCTATIDVTPTKENGLLAIGHIYNNAKLNVDKVATCMEEGLGHKYCTNPNCDDHEGSKKVVTLPKDNKNHVFDESKGSKRLHKDDVCTNSTGCYDYLTCANPACAGVKGATQIIEDTIKPGTIHKQYVEKVDSKYLQSKATCESPAVYYKSCSACGEKHVSETFVNGKALGHSFTKYVSNDNATCHSNATETAKCDRCDKTDTREIPNSTLAHKWEFTEKVAPSLENKTDGYDLYTCSLCGETKKENIVKWETLIPEPEPPKFTVTIEGGTADGQTTVQVNANGTVTVKAEVPEGKVFVGWSDGDKIISYKAEDTIQVTGDMTLTAIYEDVVVDNNETSSNNSAVIGSAIGGTVVGLLLVGIIIAIVVIVKKRKA